MLQGRTLSMLIQCQIEIERLTKQANRIVKPQLRQLERDIRVERKAIIAVEQTDEIIEARARGLTWADAARLVGFKGPASAWLLVDRVVGDAKCY